MFGICEMYFLAYIFIFLSRKDAEKQRFTISELLPQQQNKMSQF